MLVRCINADGKILKEGEIYFVTAVTKKGNFLLHDVECPLGYNCFDHTRFKVVNDQIDEWDAEWTSEMEEEFWSEQPVSYTGA
jgi:hypothetical protein